MDGRWRWSHRLVAWSPAIGAGAVENALKKAVQNLRNAARALGEMLGGAARRTLAAIKLPFEHFIAALRAHSLLFGLEIGQMATTAARDSIDAVCL
jgi:hypothetical protein